MTLGNAHNRAPRRTALVMLGLFLAATCLLVLVQTSQRSGAPVAAAADAAKSADWGGAMPRAVFSLVGIIGLIVFAGFAFRRASQRQQRAAGRQQLEIISSVSLGPKQRLVLARARDRVLVLGVTESTISKLADVALQAQRQPELRCGEASELDSGNLLSKWES